MDANSYYKIWQIERFGNCLPANNIECNEVDTFIDKVEQSLQENVFSQYLAESNEI